MNNFDSIKEFKSCIKIIDENKLIIDDVKKIVREHEIKLRSLTIDLFLSKMFSDKDFDFDGAIDKYEVYNFKGANTDYYLIAHHLLEKNKKLKPNTLYFPDLKNNKLIEVSKEYLSGFFIDTEIFNNKIKIKLHICGTKNIKFPSYMYHDYYMEFYMLLCLETNNILDSSYSLNISKLKDR